MRCNGREVPCVFFLISFLVNFHSRASARTRAKFTWSALKQCAAAASQVTHSPVDVVVVVVGRLSGNAFERPVDSRNRKTTRQSRERASERVRVRTTHTHTHIHTHSVERACAQLNALIEAAEARARTRKCTFAQRQAVFISFCATSALAAAHKLR